LKGLNATSAKATESPPPTGRSSASPRLSRTSADFALSGPSELPDPKTHAYRKDLADVALAGRVIASHYAEPLNRKITAPAVLHAAPADDAEALGNVTRGEPFSMLDNSLGWAWGYAGAERRVGYVRSEALGL
jgi:hypothetical protein